MINFIVKGLAETKLFLAKKKFNTKKNAKIGIKKATLFVQGEVKESIAGRRSEPTSVDTGRFLNSVDFSLDKFDGRIFSNVPYSGFLEFGTSRLKARRHFNNSKDRNKGKIRNIINKEIKNI